MTFKKLSAAAAVALASVQSSQALFELSCQPATRYLRMFQVVDVSPSMDPYYPNALPEAVEALNEWMDETFELGMTKGFLSFSTQQLLGNADDYCAATDYPLEAGANLQDHLNAITVSVGSDHSESALLHALHRLSEENWEVPQPQGRKVAVVYTSKMPTLPPVDGATPFDGTLNCENMNPPDVATAMDKLATEGIRVLFVVEPSIRAEFQALIGTSHVVSLHTDPAVLYSRIVTGIDDIFCDYDPTRRPDGSTGRVFTDTPTATATVPCTEDAVLQLLHLQDVSWSYDTTDLENMKSHFPQLLTALTDSFYSVELGVGSFSDKPVSPFGYHIDYCYRLDGPLDTDQTKFMDAFNALETLSGRDWAESQYDAMYEGSLSESVGWENLNEVDGRQVLRVIMLATDSGPHMAGDVPEPVGGNACEDRDYPSPAELKDALNSRNIYPIFIVMNDIYKYWNGLSVDLSDNAQVLKLGQPTEELFDAIKGALEDVCNVNSRRLKEMK